MNYKETLEYIHSLGNFSLPAGLERMKSVLKKLGDPQRDINAVHVAGTNGKGSVSVMLSSVFRKAGLKTGLFISPFILDFRERIQINGDFISEDCMEYYSEKVIKTGVSLTEFEFITAVAFLYFKDMGTDIVVCETGLGGRLDATNTLSCKKAAVITKIGLDHTAVLGNTLEKISAEKCGIINDCPVVTDFRQKKEALKVISAFAGELYIPDESNLIPVFSDLTGNEFLYKGNKYRLSLGGEFQIGNALTAIETLGRVFPEIPYETVCAGLCSAVFPARLEIISEKPIVVLDGAHNPDGAAELAKVMEKYSGNITAVIGMMKDKNTEGVLKKTLKHCRKVFCTQVPDMPRSLTAAELSEKAGGYCECVSCPDPVLALKKAKDFSVDLPLFVFGSLYLASFVRPKLLEIYKK